MMIVKRRKIHFYEIDDSVGGGMLKDMEAG